MFRSAAGFSAQSIAPRSSFQVLADPQTPIVATPLQAVTNAAAMLAEFDRLVPLRATPRRLVRRK